MKASGIVNYNVSEVFNIFKKNAKRDFKNFNEDSPIGTSVERNITTGGVQPIKCKVEITKYEENKSYEITTSNEFSKCISTYTFQEKTDGTTLLSLEEVQTTEKFIQLTTLWLQRLFAKKNFKMSFNNIIDSLNNELRVHHENIERCKKKTV